jgi:hypothetical protein
VTRSLCESKRSKQLSISACNAEMKRIYSQTHFRLNKAEKKEAKDNNYLQEKRRKIT